MGMWANKMKNKGVGKSLGSSGHSLRMSGKAAKQHTNAAENAPLRPRAFATDVRRTITGNLKRFVSLAIITALGATLLVGLKAACDDLRFAADTYYDAQDLFDISIQSTLGLDEDDIKALDKLEGVDKAEGCYTETAYTQVDGTNEKVDVKALSAQGLNEPQVLDGRLPRDVYEVAVTQKYLDATGKKIGDTVSFAGADEDMPTGAASKVEDKDSSTAKDRANTDSSNNESLSEGSLNAGTLDEDVLDADTLDEESLDEDLSTKENEAKPIFKRAVYTITGAVLDPMDVNAGSKAMSFRSTSGPKYAFFLTPAAVDDRSTYTVAYLTVSGAADLMTYSDEYKDLVDEVKQRAEAIRKQREDARTQGVKNNANAQIDNKQADVNKVLNDAQGKLDDAQSQLDSAWADIAEGKAELVKQGADAEAKLAAAQKKLNDARAQLNAGLATIEAKQAELDAGREQAQNGLAQIEQAESSMDVIISLIGENAEISQLWRRLQAGDATAKQPFAAAVNGYVNDLLPRIDEAAELCSSIDAELAKMQAGKGASPAEIMASLDRLIELAQVIAPDYVDTLKQVRDFVDSALGSDEALAQSRASIQQLRIMLLTQKDQLVTLRNNAGTLADAVLNKPQVIAALATIKAGQEQLNEARNQAYRGLGQIEGGQTALDEQRAMAAQQLADGEAQLKDGEAQAAHGQAELDRNQADFDEKKADANAQFDRARAKLSDIEHARWYIQDRSSLASYASVESDASSIESIATVFPLIFFTVAVLISLTTVTRMVEEDRGLIGVYKALGYSRAAILSKYLIYSFASCLAGGIVGDLCGFVVLPKIIFTIFTTMYALPPFELHFNAFTALLGIVLFAVGIVGATFLACRHVLKETPASLMRPKAPRAGKRILLERITPLWRRLSFLNKVSARNLFRYKKRFLMTVFGIAGCTALMICGLGIRDTVISLKPRQYGEMGISRYDVMAVTTDDNFELGEEELRNTGKVKTMLEARIDTVTAELNGTKESVQLIVVPNGADLSAYMLTPDGSNTTFFEPARVGKNLELPREGAGVLVTKNIEQVLGVHKGSTLVLQDTTLRTGNVQVEGITVNFLGNFIYMNESAYEAAFGEVCAPNALLANFKGSTKQKIALADELAAGDTFVSVTSCAKIADSFSDSFKIIDVVVYVVTIMAAALAFAVVFTLSNTNISERERELATIKVLGFRAGEVHRYINKETIILTLIGIVAGWPLGYFITRFLTHVLRMPSLFFDTIVEPKTYLIASIASLVFTLIINRFTNRSLDRIDMVGALKSAE